MEWSDVRIFLAVARAGTLGGAARSLQTSHPTVGRRLRALEQAIGHTLFQRTADGLVLTEEGHGIIALAEQMEEGALAMERRLAGQEKNLKGSLRISSADWFGAYVLPPILADFSNATPMSTSRSSPAPACSTSPSVRQISPFVSFRSTLPMSSSGGSSGLNTASTSPRIRLIPNMATGLVSG